MSRVFPHVSRKTLAVTFALVTLCIHAMWIHEWSDAFSAIYFYSFGIFNCWIFRDKSHE